MRVQVQQLCRNLRYDMPNFHNQFEILIVLEQSANVDLVFFVLQNSNNVCVRDVYQCGIVFLSHRKVRIPHCDQGVRVQVIRLPRVGANYFTDKWFEDIFHGQITFSKCKPTKTGRALSEYRLRAWGIDAKCMPGEIILFEWGKSHSTIMQLCVDAHQLRCG